MSTMTPEATAFAALGHDVRLGIFRLLVQAGPDGLRVSDVAGHLGLAPSTLAHHLSALVAAGLVEQARQGREVINRAVAGRAQALAGFLTHACCAGVARQEDAA
ncbi:MAG TPA: metalloregulator ArsR/SmtB family transcription factor [Paracoccaceae bacterium]|nr:metalloregulator ArsR/SmtB family transcription factor [Paracoccaceae bacterium]